MWDILRFSSILPSHSFHLTFALRIECSSKMLFTVDTLRKDCHNIIPFIDRNLLLFSCYIMSNLCDPVDVAHQVPLSSTVSQTLLKVMPIESVMPSNHLILF